MGGRPQNQKRTVVNLGMSLMIVILVGLSLAVIAALSLSSAKSNFNMSENLKNHTSDYYEASNMAQERIAADSFKDESFEIAMSESQVLSVEVKDGCIVKYQVENISTWESDNFLQLMD
ncbi:MAG: hypothetical protein HUJ71_04570 [Pseudobutyrivibrio sp.]|nr:hypothetical protein [Pseudobutyrivibrio sp.]